jgi:hypothetical protein
MSLLDAVIATGPVPPDNVPQAQKKRYSELLSSHMAREIAEGLRRVGFTNIKPTREGGSEKEFQGGLGSKKVDVSYSDERHGLLLAVSIKSINFAPFGKNLKNRFGDLLTEAITLHLRFPYSVVCMLFVFPVAADKDITKGRALSTFQRATRLFATVSGRRDYTDPGEKFENVTMVLFQPIKEKGPKSWVRLFDAQSRKEISEKKYFTLLRQIYNTRNPHALVGEEELETGETSEDFKERRKHHG